MTLEALRCFCAVVETRRFRGAAERLHRSQPAVSQQVKSLEDELGQVLLDRKLGRCTPAGQVFYEQARHILSEVDALGREMQDFDETAAAELRVGTSDTTALYFLPPFVRAFARALPRTRLVIVNRPSDAVADLVAGGELDLGITTLPVGRASLAEQALFEQQLALVVPRRHRLGRREEVRLSDLREEPLLLLEPQTRTGALLREHFRREGFEPQIVMDSGSFEVIKRYVAEGIGVSFLPRSVITSADKSVATVQVQGLPSVRIGAIWRHGAYLTKSAKLFLRMLEAPA